MSSVESTWLDVWDAVFAIVQGVDSIGDEVYQGMKLPPIAPDEGVIVLVAAGTSSLAASDTHGDYHVYSIPVYVFTQGDDTRQALRDCILWTGKIKKELLGHRTLDNLVNDIRISQSRANPPDVAGYERQLVAFVVEARVWVDDPDSEE